MGLRYTPSLNSRTVSGLSVQLGIMNGTVSRLNGAANLPGASSAVAQRPRYRIPRPSLRPFEAQSIQPIVIGHSPADSLSKRTYSPMSGTRRVSPQIQLLGI